MDKVGIIVVTYNPEIKKLIYNIKTYINQSDLVVLVDNSTVKDIKDGILKEFSGWDNVIVITLDDNYGIGRAQNIGIKFLKELNIKYFVEIDQDSSLPENYVLKMYNTFVELRSNGVKVAGLGSLAYNEEYNVTYNKIARKYSRLIEVDKIHSSGFFSSIDVVEDIGYKNEDLFIDYVDYEWCWRARHFGYKIYILTDNVINHKLGLYCIKKGFFIINVGSPIRHYYQYRNHILLFRLKYVPLTWKIKRIFVNFFKLFIILLFYNDKLNRYKNIFKGTIHGIIGKSGKVS